MLENYLLGLIVFFGFAFVVFLYDRKFLRGFTNLNEKQQSMAISSKITLDLVVTGFLVYPFLRIPPEISQARWFSTILMALIVIFYLTLLRYLVWKHKKTAPNKPPNLETS